MAQCFVSTYRNHFRWQEPTFRPKWKQDDKSLDAIPFEDMWIESKKAEQPLNKEIDQWLQSCYKDRMKSVYQRDNSKQSSQTLEGESIENELLEYCKSLYEPQSRPKIASPLAGSRKVFGYIRPSRNYTLLTVYQWNIGQVAYTILKHNNSKKVAGQLDEKKERLETETYMENAD